MAKRRESRYRVRQRLESVPATPTVDEILELTERLELRVSKVARGMLEKRAKEKLVTPAVLHRRVLYTYLGLIEGEI